MGIEPTSKRVKPYRIKREYTDYKTEKICKLSLIYSQNITSFGQVNKTILLYPCFVFQLDRADNRQFFSPFYLFVIYTLPKQENKLPILLGKIKIIANMFYPVGNKYKFFMPVYKCFIRFTMFQVCPQLSCTPSV